MRALVLASLVALAMGPAAASDVSRPYAGLETREIKALSQERREGLLAGSGLGYALAAELNGLPGPRHVLDMAAEIALTEEQASAVGAVFEAMNAEARALGAQIVDAEADLDALFARGEAAPQEVAAATARVAALEGRLRAAHLNAHLVTAPILSRHQRVLYARARWLRGRRPCRTSLGLAHGRRAVARQAAIATSAFAGRFAISGSASKAGLAKW